MRFAFEPATARARARSEWGAGGSNAQVHVGEEFAVINEHLSLMIAGVFSPFADVAYYAARAEAEALALRKLALAGYEIVERTVASTDPRNWAHLERTLRFVARPHRYTMRRKIRRLYQV